MFVVRNRKIFYTISAVLIITSVLALLVWGLNLGIDFKGGSLLEVEYTSARPDKALVENTLEPLGLGDFSLRATGDNGFILRLQEIDQGSKNSVLGVLSLGGDYPLVEKRFNSIGPVLGKEAGSRSILSIILVILGIIIFITFVFRKVSKPVSSWKYGVIAIFALIHDILIPTGVFAALGHFRGVEIDTLFVTALLVVLGFSVHDTIVVFDRVRENLKINQERKHKKDFDKIVGESVEQTYVRSINTSITTIVALLALFILAGDVVRFFSLALIIGVAAGTYSSIFFASPLLVTFERLKKKK